MVTDGDQPGVGEIRNAPLAAKLAGHGHVIVNGTVIETARVRLPTRPPGADLRQSGKIHNHGGNIQVAAAPDAAGRCGTPTSAPPLRVPNTHTRSA